MTNTNDSDILVAVTITLTSNTLNQYTQRTVPGAIDVRGRALAIADVAVNDSLATRQGDSFHRAVPVDNTTAPQHPQIRVQALEPGTGPGGADLKAEELGRVYLPKTPEVFTYDFDGNLLSDGRWTCTWDAYNRLVAMESVASVPVTAKKKLEFLYDGQDRRIRKRVYNWSGSAYVIASERRYLYDGWNLVAEIVTSPAPFARTYVWGLDLSGSEQGAGGVGGLLAIREAAESHLPVYDGNGNVTALVKASNGALSGRYVYGAFGEVLEREEVGIENPFRFSTKFEDVETGWLYYGFRYYVPETGRWASRDPIEEEGGVNLYGFVGNDGVGGVDYLGMTPTPNEVCGCLTIKGYIQKLSQSANAINYPERTDSTTGRFPSDLSIPKKYIVFVRVSWKTTEECRICAGDNVERRVSRVSANRNVLREGKERPMLTSGGSENRYTLSYEAYLLGSSGSSNAFNGFFGGGLENIGSATIPIPNHDKPSIRVRVRVNIDRSYLCWQNTYESY